MSSRISLRRGEADPPPSAAGALRLRVEATALNRADLLQRQGLYPPPPGASSILGLECAGEVIEVADRVLVLAKGRQVALLERSEASLQRVVNLAFGVEVEAA